MSWWQWMLLGMMIAWSPALVVLALLVRRVDRADREERGEGGPEREAAP
jgi:hypothetical protein